jgi:hypothetical protein
MASKDDLECAKRDLQIKELRRKERIAAWNDYVGFATSKLVKLTATVSGRLGLVSPATFVKIPHPEMLLGGGIAILGDNRALSVLGSWTESPIGGEWPQTAFWEKTTSDS